MSDNTLNCFNCAECGIAFGFAKGVEDLWRTSKKNFFCPNGHSLSFKDGPKESEKDSLKKEIKRLKERENELLGELAVSADLLAKEKKKVEELTLELEIWKPSSKGE